MNYTVKTLAALIEAEIDTLKSGKKLDRKKLVTRYKKQCALSMSDLDYLIGIICRAHPDVDNRRGKQGGTFKK